MKVHPHGGGKGCASLRVLWWLEAKIDALPALPPHKLSSRERASEAPSDLASLLSIFNPLFPR